MKLSDRLIPIIIKCNILCVAFFRGNVTLNSSPLGSRDMYTRHVILLCLQPQISASRNSGSPWPWPSSLALPPVFSTAQHFANNPIRCQNAATRHQLRCLPRVSTGQVGFFLGDSPSPTNQSFRLLCNISKQGDKSLLGMKEGRFSLWVLFYLREWNLQSNIVISR